MLLAQVPQTARVNRKELKAPEVKYQGDPQFEPIPKTTVARAVNTDKDIIKVGDLYYMCFQGVWFMSRKRGRARGKWPPRFRRQIYEIPAELAGAQRDLRHGGRRRQQQRLGDVCRRRRLHRHDGGVGLRGVGHRAGTTRRTSATAASTRCTTRSIRPTATRPGTTRGAAPTAAAPWRTDRTAASARRRGTTRAPAPTRAAPWRTGPYGARGAAQAYNPRTGTYAQTRQGSGVYGSWGSTAVQRGDDWAQTSRVTNRATGNTTRVTRTDEGGMVSRRGGPGGGGFVAAGDEGNVYAGHDGNVYKRQEGGGWQKYDNGGWTNTDKPAQGRRDARAADHDRPQRNPNAARHGHHWPTRSRPRRAHRRRHAHA